MKKHFLFIAMNILWLSASGNSIAFEFSVEFSADAIQVAPGRSPVYSKMFVSKDAVRTEMMQQGKRLVDIAYPKNGKRILIDLDEKSFMEQKGLVVQANRSGMKAKTPCEGIPGATCQSLGKEKVQNIVTEKWQVERKINGKTFRSLHWIDNNRRLAIKEMYPDGSVTELLMLGKTELNGRKVEQWEQRFNHPSGQTRIARQWYDPQLKIVIREEMDGGYLRELNNIKVGNQDGALFKIPEGFKKVTVDNNNRY